MKLTRVWPSNLYFLFSRCSSWAHRCSISPWVISNHGHFCSSWPPAIVLFIWFYNTKTTSSLAPAETATSYSILLSALKQFKVFIGLLISLIHDPLVHHTVLNSRPSCSKRLRLDSYTAGSVMHGRAHPSILLDERSFARRFTHHRRCCLTNISVRSQIV